MLQTLKGLLESKPIVVALLTAIAAGAAVFGFNVNVTTVLLIITPIEVAIGATGWGEMSMKHQMDAQVKMHMMSLQHATMGNAAGLNAVVDSASPKTPQAGFAKLGVMVIIALLIGACTIGVSCSSAQRANGLTCAEGTLSITQLAEIAADLADKNYDDLLTNLAAKEGFALIKCGIETVFAVHAAPPAEGSGSGTVALTPDPVRAHASAWLAKHGAAK